LGQKTKRALDFGKPFKRTWQTAKCPEKVNPSDVKGWRDREITDTIRHFVAYLHVYLTYRVDTARCGGNMYFIFINAFKQICAVIFTDLAPNNDFAIFDSRFAGDWMIIRIAQ
jgi:hypothetical protein